MYMQSIYLIGRPMNERMKGSIFFRINFENCSEKRQLLFSLARDPHGEIDLICVLQVVVINYMSVYGRLANTIYLA